MTARNKDARVRGGRRKSTMNTNAAIVAQAALIDAELARVEADHSIPPIRRAEAIATLQRKLASIEGSR
jgi:hypothetical protein